jgi:hypothetical protein
MTPNRTTAILILGDLVCLAGFVLVGMQQHETLGGQNAITRFAINTGPIALAWLASGLALGAFRLAPLPSFWRATVLAWLVAAPLGLLVRALLLNSAILVVIFVLITLGLGGAILLAWRTLFAVIARRLQPAGI